MKKLILSMVLLLGTYTHTKAQALNFDGQDDYVYLPNGLPSMSNVTIEAWVYPQTLQNDFDALLTYSGWSTGWMHFQFNPTGALEFSINGNNPTDQYCSAPFSTNQWYHIAVVYSSANNYAKFYVNGTLTDSLVYSTALSTAANVPFDIGAWTENSRFFNGTIDEFRVWDIARTQAQIQDNMNCSLTAQADLVANYTFNGGAAVPNQNNTGITLVMDNSFNTNTGTLTNFALNGTSSNWVNNVPKLNPVAYASVTSGTTTIGAGTTLTFTATPVNGGSAPAYQWMKNNVHVGSNSSVYSDNTLVNKDTVTCMITSSGNCIAKDSVSNKTGITVTQLAASLNFDGIDDYIDIGSLNLSSYTKEAWIYASASASCNIISSNGAPFWLSGGYLSATNGYGGGGTVISDPALFDLNVWTHVAVTYDNTTGILTLYKNGIPVTPNTPEPAYLKEDIHIGEYGGSNNFQGNMDEVHIWNVARTAAQIKKDMNCIVSATQLGLVASYNFNEGTPNNNNVGLITLTDNSGNGNNGTLYNFDLSGGSSSNWTNDADRVNPLPVISGISGVSMLCAGATTTLTVNGTAATYTWSANASSAVTTTVSVQPANTATFNVTGANGACLVIDSLVVTVNPLPSISVNNATICAGNSATLTVSGTVTSYNWSTGDNTISIAPTPTANTSYTVTGMDANCSNMTVATVTVNQLPAISVNNPVICTGNTATLTVSGTVTSYTWNNGENTLSITPTPTANTSYTVTGMDANCSNMTVATVTVNQLPAISVNSATICTGNSATLTVSGTVTSYTWNTGDNTISITPTPTANTSYTITGMDATCSNKAVATVKVNPLPTILVNNATICTGNSATLTVSGTATSYTWNTGDNTISIAPTPTANTSYTVTGMDAGCSNMMVATVTVNQLPLVSFSVSPNSYCSTAPSVTLAASPAGGAYSGSGVSTDQFNPGTAGAGTYTLTYMYTDANTCSNTAAAVVTVQVCTTGIDQLSNTSVSSYPNPTSGDLYIQTATALDNATVEVYDMIGQKVWTEKLHDTVTHLSLSNLNNAVYQVRVLNNNSLIYQTKVVKQQ